jgi:polyhydroxybutyrate depolymerase
MLLRAIVVAVVVTACGGSSPPADRPTVFGGDARPATLHVPDNFVDDGTTYPLVMVLHGYGVTGFIQDAYFEMSPTPDGVFVIAPDGTVDSTGSEFWNADPACCDFGHTGVDDSGYLGGILDDVLAAWPIDPGAVHVIGHSNGGFMAYRMACDHADTIASIVVLAGAAASDASTCTPSQPVNVLHMHGSADDTVLYSVAMPSVMQWAQHDGCAATMTPGPNLDIDNDAGAETTTATADGCPADGQVELWTLVGAGHIPGLNPDFSSMILAYMADHSRP